MFRNALPRFFYTLLAICILAGLFSAPVVSTTEIALADQAVLLESAIPSANDVPDPVQAPSANHIQNLPMIFGPPTPKFFGIEFESFPLTPDRVLAALRARK